MEIEIMNYVIINYCTNAEFVLYFYDNKKMSI